MGRWKSQTSLVHHGVKIKSELSSLKDRFVWDMAFDSARVRIV